MGQGLSAGWRHAHNDAMSSESPFAAVLPAPFGALGIRVSADRLVALEFLSPGTSLVAPTSALLERVAAELAAYYADPSHRFRLPLAPVGTAFRLRVWDALQAIPPGQTTTYGQLARRLGTSARAVGQALGDNPLPIVIPCHRVVAADGSLGGFNHSHSGYSLDIKRWLLAHEGAR